MASQQNKTIALKKEGVKTTSAALILLFLDAIVVGAPLFSIFVALYIALCLLPAAIYFVFNNKQKAKLLFSRAVVYSFTIGLVIAIYKYNISVSKQKAEIVIAAVNNYYSDNNMYPDNLNSLVPIYLEVIPEPNIFTKKLYYINTEELTDLFYVEYPPFYRKVWKFRESKWAVLD